MIPDPPADIVAAYLIQQGLAVAPTNPPTNPPTDWQVTSSKMPDAGDNALAVRDLTPIKDGRVMNTGETVYHYSIQVKIRGVDYVTGHARAVVIANDFDGLKQATPQIVYNGRTYKLGPATVTVPLTHWGEETRKRELFGLNVKLPISF
jgi:hypothetical protein